MKQLTTVPKKDIYFIAPSHAMSVLCPTIARLALKRATILNPGPYGQERGFYAQFQPSTIIITS